MAYVRRVSRRRGSRRRSRTLSTRNIFSNKGARSQAKQISALKKRITAVNRKCRPEVKVVERSATTSYGFAANSQITGTQQAVVQTMSYPGPGTGDSERIGDKVSLLPTELFVTLQYEEIYNSLLQGLTTVQLPLPTSAIQARIVFVQSKIAGQTLALNTLNQIFEDNAYGSGNASLIDAQMAMKMPFKTGVTTKWNILSDKIITVSKDTGQKAYRFKVRPKIRGMRWFEGTAEPPVGTIYMVVLTSGWSYITHPVAGEDDRYDFNKLNFSYRVRQPFTDA